jgi:hypothetical protein
MIAMVMIAMVRIKPFTFEESVGMFLEKGPSVVSG